MHRRPNAHRGGVTAYFEMKKEKAPREYSVQYTLARCNPCDTFNKRLGRIIAKGRFDKNSNIQRFKIFADDVKEMRDVAISRMDSLCRYELNELFYRYDAKIQRAVRIFECELRKVGLA